MTRTSLAILFLSPLLLCGCLPIPNRTQAIPKLSGTVFRDGNPVQGAEIRVTYGLDRDKIAIVGRTDKDGVFSYPGKKDFNFFVSIGDPGFDWSLTVQSAGQTYLGFSDRGLGYVPEMAQFRCDLPALKDQPACRSL